MARLKVKDYVTIGASSSLTGVWWQISRVPRFDPGDIIEESKYNPAHITEWNTPILLVPGDPTSAYDGQEVIFVRVKIRIGSVESGWYEREICPGNKEIRRGFVYTFPLSFGG